MLGGSAWASRGDRACASVEYPQQRPLAEWERKRARRRAELAEKTARRQAEFTALLPAIAAQVAADVSAAVAAALQATRAEPLKELDLAPTTTTTSIISESSTSIQMPGGSSSISTTGEAASASHDLDLPSAVPVTCSTDCPRRDNGSSDATASVAASVVLDVALDISAPTRCLTMEPSLGNESLARVLASAKSDMALAEHYDKSEEDEDNSVPLFQWDPGEQTRTSKNLLTSRVIILSVGVKELTEDSYGDSDNYKEKGYIRDANKDEVFLPLKLLVPLSKSKEPGMCPGLGCATTHSVCLLPWDPGEKPMVLRDSVLSRDIAWPACVKKMNADLSGSHDYDQKSGYADTQTYLHWLIQLSCSSANVIGKYFCLRLLIASIGAIHCFQVYWSHFKWALVIVSSLQTLGSYCLISDHYHCDPESMHWKILWFHSLLESGFQFWTAGKAHGYGAAKIQLDIAWPTTTLPYSTLYCMHLYFALECSVVICSWKIEIKSLGICSIFLLHLPSGLAGFIRHQLGAKPKFQWEIAWLLVWSYGARSDFLYMWLVTILSWLHFKLGVLPLVHFRDLSCWRSQSVDQMLKTGHVIHCGLELVQWKIAWLINSEYSDVISQSKQLIPAATMTYHVLCSPWDPGIWALLCSYRFSAR